MKRVWGKSYYFNFPSHKVVFARTVSQAAAKTYFNASYIGLFYSAEDFFFYGWVFGPRGKKIFVKIVCTRTSLSSFKVFRVENRTGVNLIFNFASSHVATAILLLRAVLHSVFWLRKKPSMVLVSFELFNIVFLIVLYVL